MIWSDFLLVIKVFISFLKDKFTVYRICVLLNFTNLKKNLSGKRFEVWRSYVNRIRWSSCIVTCMCIKFMYKFAYCNKYICTRMSYPRMSRLYTQTCFLVQREQGMCSAFNLRHTPLCAGYHRLMASDACLQVEIHRHQQPFKLRIINPLMSVLIILRVVILDKFQFLVGQ